MNPYQFTISSEVDTQQKLIGLYKSELGFPDYCSVKNWDALNDCLDDALHRYPQGVIVRHEGPCGLGPEDLSTYLEVLHQVTPDWPTFQLWFDLSWITGLNSKISFQDQETYWQQRAYFGPGVITKNSIGAGGRAAVSARLRSAFPFLAVGALTLVLWLLA